MSRRLAALCLLALTLSACGGSDGDSAPSAAALKTAVQNYSDAFLTGDADTAYGLFSKRCQDRHTKSDFAAELTTVKAFYGSKLRFATYSADVNGEQATVTYTYAEAPEINQDSAPWVAEDGSWHDDEC